VSIDKGANEGKINNIEIIIIQTTMEKPEENF